MVPSEIQRGVAVKILLDKVETLDGSNFGVVMSFDGTQALIKMQGPSGYSILVPWWEIVAVTRNGEIVRFDLDGYGNGFRVVITQEA